MHPPAVARQQGVHLPLEFCTCCCPPSAGSVRHSVCTACAQESRRRVVKVHEPVDHVAGDHVAYVGAVARGDDNVVLVEEVVHAVHRVEEREIGVVLAARKVLDVVHRPSVGRKRWPALGARGPRAKRGWQSGECAV